VKFLLGNAMSQAALAATFSLATLVASSAHAVGFRTDDPLKAFLGREYPLGDDYFIAGNADTFIFRCVLTRQKDGVDGLALSEISIWGNRTGPWEIFRRDEAAGFVYVETRHLADTACLEACRSREFLASGQCQWKRGWPK